MEKARGVGQQVVVAVPAGIRQEVSSAELRLTGWGVSFRIRVSRCYRLGIETP